MKEAKEEKRKHDRRASEGHDIYFLAGVLSFATIATATLSWVAARVLGIISCILWIAGCIEEKMLKRK